MDAVLGTILILAALAMNIGLVLWSQRTIRRIAEKGAGPYRKIMKDLRDGG